MGLRIVIEAIYAVLNYFNRDNTFGKCLLHPDPENYLGESFLRLEKLPVSPTGYARHSYAWGLCVHTARDFI